MSIEKSLHIVSGRDSHNDSSDDHYNANDMDDVQQAENEAEHNLEFVTIEDGKNHCHCELWEGKRCIEQFSQPEQDKIR